MLRHLWLPRNPGAKWLAVAIGLVVLVAAWNLSAPPDANATFRENAGTPLITTPTEALDQAESRIGYRPLVPDLGRTGLELTDVRLTMPPASNARFPRTELDFRHLGGEPGLILVAQGREDWLPNGAGWVDVDLGISSVQAVRAGTSAADGSLEYRLRIGEWRFAILFFGPVLPPDEIEHMLRQVSRELIDSPPPDCHDGPVHAGGVPGCARGSPP